MAGDDSKNFWEAVGYKTDDPSSLRIGEVFLLEHGHRREVCKVVQDYGKGFFAVPVDESLLPERYRVVIMGKSLSMEELDE